jgi:hypothetical protein
MGAEQFCEFIPGSDATVAFMEAVEQARYDYGHAGYTGTIGEKDAFVIYTPPTGKNINDVIDAFERSYFHRPDWADAAFDAAAAQYNDKWEAAVAIKHNDGWYFLGYASS